MMAQPLSGSDADDGSGHGRAPTEGADEARLRLVLAQQGFLALRLEAAQGRISALETELAAERLLMRRVLGECAETARALALQRDAEAQAARQRDAASAQAAALKQELHEALRQRQQMEAQILRATDALKTRGAEVARLEAAAAELRARVGAVEARRSALACAHQLALGEMAERLEKQHSEVRLLQRALDLARDNRRALHSYIGTLPVRNLPLALASAESEAALDRSPAAFAPASPAALSLHQGAPSVACSQ